MAGAEDCRLPARNSPSSSSSWCQTGALPDRYGSTLRERSSLGFAGARLFVSAVSSAVYRIESRVAHILGEREPEVAPRAARAGLGAAASRSSRTPSRAPPPRRLKGAQTV